MKRLSWKLLRFTGSCLIICFVGLSQPRTLASQSAHYKNLRWNFCAEIPPKWNRDEGFNGAGVFAYPPQKARGKERSGVEIGALYNQPSEKHTGSMQTLDEIFTGRPDVLGNIQSLEVLSKRTIAFHGNSAIYSRMRYKLEGEAWMAENITFLTSQGVVYLLEMRCRRNQFEAFDRIFRSMAFHSFKLNCR